MALSTINYIVALNPNLGSRAATVASHPWIARPVHFAHASRADRRKDLARPKAAGRSQQVSAAFTGESLITYHLFQ
jgi:hypothetical protein